MTPVLNNTFSWSVSRDAVFRECPRKYYLARKINALNELLKRTDTFKKANLEALVILPTGDGMAVGFPDSPEKPLRLAIELHKSLKKFKKTQKEKDRIIIRIGIDTGPVYFMKGIRGEIFWGPGLIMAKRVMDLCGPNQIFASRKNCKRS